MNLGVGVMLGHLSGNEASVNAVQSSLTKRIVEIDLDKEKDPEQIRLKFEDQSVLILTDEGQSCCESRYVSSDDKFEDFLGSTLEKIELAESPNLNGPEDYEEHEVQFLRVYTSKGVLVFQTHNEHNGCYGGFHICARMENS